MKEYGKVVLELLKVQFDDWRFKKSFSMMVTTFCLLKRVSLVTEGMNERLRVEFDTMINVGGHLRL